MVHDVAPARTSELDDAQKVLQEDRERREDACTQEIQKLLAHYRCRFDPVVSFTFDGRTPLCSINIRSMD